MTQSLDRAHELLRKAAAQFRFYETQHRGKIGVVFLKGTPKADDTLRKAEANASHAAEIENYLAHADKAVDDDLIHTQTMLQEPVGGAPGLYISEEAADEEFLRLSGVQHTLQMMDLDDSAETSAEAFYRRQREEKA